jgi:hypothetical protein
MRVTIVEGTPEEIREALPHLTSATILVNPAGPANLPAAEAPGSANEGEKAFVSLAVARRVLTRRPLSKEQRIVLASLYDAHPDMVSTALLQKAAGYSPAQLAGLFGAFGRRLANTDGYIADTHFFDYKWEEGDGSWHYGLPETVREALCIEKIVPERHA